MNAAQKVLVATYGNGDYAHVTTREEAGEAGDTLFTFLWIELDEKEDCDSLEEAVERVNDAIRQMVEVADALSAEIDP